MKIEILIGFDRALLGLIGRGVIALEQISMKETQMVATVDAFIADMTAKMTTQTTEIASVKTLIQSLFAQIAAGLPSLTQAQMTALDAIEAGMDANSQAILDAQKANTPPA